MSVFIKKIELKNWFNYKGDYNENVFEFDRGINIVVAGNDIGKSKLHNAFRWIIDDTVILKTEKRDGTAQFDINTINQDTISKVLSYSIPVKLKHNESANLGVRITFSILKGGEEKDFIATKEIICKKDGNRLMMVQNILKTLEKVDPHTKSPRKTVEFDFDKTVGEIIKENYKNFFLVQGESLSTMTPLKGSALRTTMNNIVSINILDDIAKISDDIYLKSKKKKNDIELSLANLTNDERKRIKTIKDFEDKNLEINTISIPELTTLISTNKDIVDTYRNNANNAKETKRILKEFTDNDILIKTQEQLETNELNSIIKNYINENFSLSKLSDDNNDSKLLDELDKKYKDFATTRNLELNDALDKEEQKMIYALEKSQPKPEILEEMLKAGTCYVCKSTLEDTNKTYIKDKLIPFFRNVKVNDDESLRKYENLMGFAKFFKFPIDKFKTKNLDYFKDENKRLEEIITTKNKFNNIKKELINTYGNPDNNIDNVSISTYDTAKKNLEKYEDNLKDFESEIELNEMTIRRLKSEKKSSNNDPKLLNSIELEEFTEDLKDVLYSIRERIYSDFAKKLEEKASVRFKKLVSENVRLNKQKIKVELSFDTNKSANFEIKVIDQDGHSQNDGGGASQAVRQIAVVFALIDLSSSRILYPFIADAPTSNMSGDIKKLFFIDQINDERANQRIIITMDLWQDSPKPGKLNSLGDQVLKLIQDKYKSSFTTITYDEITNKTTINKIK